MGQTSTRRIYCISFYVCSLNEKGGDWDRRNRLKVYEATHAMVQRGAWRRG